MENLKQRNRSLRNLRNYVRVGFVMNSVILIFIIGIPFFFTPSSLLLQGGWKEIDTTITRIGSSGALAMGVLNGIASLNHHRPTTLVMVLFTNALYYFFLVVSLIIDIVTNQHPESTVVIGAMIISLIISIIWAFFAGKLSMTSDTELNFLFNKNNSSSDSDGV